VKKFDLQEMLLYLPLLINKSVSESLFSKHLFQNQFQLKILGKEKLLRATCNGYLIAAIDIFNFISHQSSLHQIFRSNF